MKKYFEDNVVPFVTPKMLTVQMDTPPVVNTPKLLRQHFSLPCWVDEDGFIDHSYYPGLMTRYVLQGEQYVFDDYGNLTVAQDDKGVMINWSAPVSIMESSDPLEAVFTVDCFGTVWLLDQDEDGQYWCICTLGEDGGADANADQLELPPGSWYCTNKPRIIQAELGWDILHQHATMDGMLCIRWLNLYGSVPVKAMPRNGWGYCSHASWDARSRQTSREMFQHETHNAKEVAAECFPMEVGSLLARYRVQAENRCSIGVVYDPTLSDLRKIYPEDCYSEYHGDALESTRDWLPSWEGWSNARTAWDAAPAQRRCRRSYTEGFVKNPVPVGLIVYGKMSQRMTADTIQLMKKFRKNGYPVYVLQAAE